MKKLLLSVLLGMTFGFLGVLGFKIIFAQSYLGVNSYVTGPVDVNSLGAANGLLVPFGKVGVNLGPGVAPQATLHVKGGGSAPTNTFDTFRIDQNLLSSPPAGFTQPNLLPINVNGLIYYLMVYNQPLPSMPAAPTGLSSNSVTANSIGLSWNDNSNNENNFVLWRSLDGATYNQIATPAANTTTYTDSGLSPVFNYYYRVQACNTIGCSSYSSNSFVTLATPQCSDGLDNDGDGLVDAADPNCHLNGDLGQAYQPSWNDELNSPTSGGSGVPSGCFYDTDCNSGETCVGADPTAGITGTCQASSPQQPAF